MHPPIHTVMRLVENDMNYNGIKIPKGHFLCSGITVGHYNEAKFPEPHLFKPERHSIAEDGGEWTIGGVDIAQKSARNLYLPFGAGSSHINIQVVIAVSVNISPLFKTRLL